MSALGYDTISAKYSEADGQISISEYKEPDINSFIVFLVEILKNTTNTKVIIQSLPEKYAKVFFAIPNKVMDFSVCNNEINCSMSDIGNLVYDDTKRLCQKGGCFERNHQIKSRNIDWHFYGI